MDVDLVMLPIGCNVPAMLEGDTPEIIHPEPYLPPIFELPNQALVSNDKEITYVQINCGNDCALMVIREHKQSSMDTDCDEFNADHEVHKSAVPHERKLFQGIK
jgi:hypothetical protein